MHTQSPTGVNNYAVSPAAGSEFLLCMIWGKRTKPQQNEI